MSNGYDNLKFNRLSYITPGFIRNFIKRLYWRIKRYYDKCRYIQKDKFVYLDSNFRFERIKPYKAFIGEMTNTDVFNVWNASFGDITVGKRCFFGLHNIIMGPVDIGDDTSTGPYVRILGPRHAFHGYEMKDKKKTKIGKKVWISTGAIILFGVSIGDNAVIGPGAVVTKDVARDTYVAGNPARDLTKLSGFDKLTRKSGD